MMEDKQDYQSQEEIEVFGEIWEEIKVIASQRLQHQNLIPNNSRWEQSWSLLQVEPELARIKEGVVFYT